MLLATQTDWLAEVYGEVGCMAVLKEAGFTALDKSFFRMTEDDCVWNKEGWKEYAQEIRREADRCGMIYVQAHAPFPSSRCVTDPKSPDYGKENTDYSRQMLERIVRAMEAAAILGAKVIVVHPRQHLSYVDHARELAEENRAFYRSLIPYCEKFGIRVAAENMWQYDSKRGHIVDSTCSSPEEFCAYLDDVNSPWITGCLDIGHCALTGHDPAAFIRTLGPRRLQALHVHDVDYHQDCHTLPFTRDLDWNAITAALAEIGYEGVFTFEADRFLTPFPKELLPAASRLMAETGRWLTQRSQAK